MTELDLKNLNETLQKTLKTVENTVAWAEARGYANTQEYMQFEDSLNKLSVKDHNIHFATYNYLD